MTAAINTDFLEILGVESLNPGVSTGSEWKDSKGDYIASRSPINGALIGKVKTTTREDYDQVMEKAQKAFKSWRMIPAPKRGEILRQFGEKLRRRKTDLGKLISYEVGKSLKEGTGEVQGMINMCDFATGLSRQLHGFTFHSEHPEHRIYEQWHPLGAVGIITAFNFPGATWILNAALAWICGNVCVWKPSEQTPLTAVACQTIMSEVLDENQLPEGISCLITGDDTVGEYLTTDKRIPLISATGSVAMGKIVGTAVAARLGKTLLELGGNNGIIITPDADLEITARITLFGAIGTCAQRCTTPRRLIVQESIYDSLKQKLIHAYDQIRIGNPFDEHNHVGPLINKEAAQNYVNALEAVQKEGGRLLVEAGVMEGEGYESGCYVKPCIVEVEAHYDTVQQETFAPILYLLKYKDLEEAIAMNNMVSQGLSSAIMTTNMRETEIFLSQQGSDCGIANVNASTSGTEIGAAFGGEKESGHGREAGSDAWKTYMRRQTNTINYGTELPPAQDIKFNE